MKTGIYGGAFNPIHNGHIRLAKHYVSELKLDRIIFVPVCVPPDRSASELISGEHRLNMISLAFFDKSDPFEVSSAELDRKGKSYTYDTVCAFEKLYPDDCFYLLVGADRFFDFMSWHKAEDILKKVVLCTAARECGEYEKLLDFRAKNSAFADSEIYDFDVTDVSSSEIRRRIKAGLPISGMLPEAVIRYIKENDLYV